MTNIVQNAQNTPFATWYAPCYTGIVERDTENKVNREQSWKRFDKVQRSLEESSKSLGLKSLLKNEVDSKLKSA